MAIFFNVLYTVLTVMAAVTIGFDNWLAVALIIAAIFQTVGIVSEAINLERLRYRTNSDTV